MRIVFIGTVEFSLQMLQSMLKNGVGVAGVITAKDSGINSDYANLLPICEKYDIPYLLTNNVNAHESVDWVSALNPDLIFCFGWSSLIKKELLKLPLLGVIGFHPTDLPKNRGRHPLIWALVLGLRKTASTFFFMDEGVDSGDIISQQQIDIDDNDDAQSLYNKVINSAKNQLSNMIPLLRSGEYQRIPQEHSRANVWRKRNIADGRIDWRMSAQRIHNLVRGLTHPYIGAYFTINSIEYKVWKTEMVKNKNIENIEPGQVIDVDDEGCATLKCADMCLKLVDVEPKFLISVGDYL